MVMPREIRFVEVVGRGGAEGRDGGRRGSVGRGSRNSHTRCNVSRARIIYIYIPLVGQENSLLHVTRFPARLLFRLFEVFLTNLRVRLARC